MKDHEPTNAYEYFIGKRVSNVVSMLADGMDELCEEQLANDLAQLNDEYYHRYYINRFNHLCQNVYHIKVPRNIRRLLIK